MNITSFEPQNISHVHTGDRTRAAGMRGQSVNHCAILTVTISVNRESYNSTAQYNQSGHTEWLLDEYKKMPRNCLTESGVGLIFFLFFLMSLNAGKFQFPLVCFSTDVKSNHTHCLWKVQKK